MKSRMVSYTLQSLPPMTEEERERLRELALLPSDQIDTSDIPEISSEQAQRAVRGWQNHPGRTKQRSKHAA